MALSARSLLVACIWYGFGLSMLVVYFIISLITGSFFKRETEKDRLQLAIARDKIWNLSKQYDGLTHKFYVLRNGLRLHYVTNEPERAGPPKPLVILIHGWPDSYSVWHFVIQSRILRERSTIVAVDLPGFGGSDSFPPYNATVVLEALAEFVVGMREIYDISNDANSGNGMVDNSGGQQKVYVVGHDWGCILSYRLASEAPALADRFILTNGPLPQLARANKDRMTCVARKMFRAFSNAPLASRHCLPKALRACIPLARQAYRLGYVVAFHLPAMLVRYLLSGGNRSFLRGIHGYATGVNNSQLDSFIYLAGCLGPSVEECKTQTEATRGAEPRSYPPSVVKRTVNGNGSYETTEYYRSGAMTDPWDKSLETIAALYEVGLSQGVSQARRRSSGALLFSEPYEGALKAPTTVIWGQQDPILLQQLCLDGIGDYLAKGSQVILLPRTGHWTTSEVEGREAVRKVVEWAVQGEDCAELENVVQEVYDGASIGVKR